MGWSMAGILSAESLDSLDYVEVDDNNKLQSVFCHLTGEKVLVRLGLMGLTSSR